MKTSTPPLSIADLNTGHIIEQVNEELRLVAANILDPNTDAEKPREVSLVLKLKPSKNRNAFTIDAQVKSKLAPVQAIESLVFISQKRDGTIVLSARDEKQEEMFNGETAEQRDQRDRQQAAAERQAAPPPAE